MATNRKLGIRINLIYLIGFVMVLIVMGSLFPGCQSRSWSRYTGAPLELELPRDFMRPISFSTGREGEKDLFYETSDGHFKVKTYTDTGMFESEIQFTQRLPSE